MGKSVQKHKEWSLNSSPHIKKLGMSLSAQVASALCVGVCRDVQAGRNGKEYGLVWLAASQAPDIVKHFVLREKGVEIGHPMSSGFCIGNAHLHPTPPPKKP